MPWPYLWESTFDLGTNAEWASETDTGSRLDFPHYSQLAQGPGSEMAPAKGAFCMRVDAGDANDHFVARTDAIVAIASTGWFRFQFLVGSNWNAAATTNTVSIFRLQGVATTTVIASVGFRTGRLSSNSVELGVGNSVPTVFDTSPIDLNRWYSLEVQVVTAADITTGALGSNTLYVNGIQRATVTGGQQTVNATTLKLGLMDGIAADTGALLFDNVVQASTLTALGRIGPMMLDGEMTRTITKDQHLFVGPGTLDNASLISVTGVATGAAAFYDTDHGGVTDSSKLKAVINATVNGEVVDLAGVPVQFTRGCYVVLTPTVIASTPRLTASFRAHSEASRSNKRQIGLKTRNRAAAADSL